jgi:uncharacterized protein (DUF1810 family)
MDEADPHKLMRFVERQREDHAKALRQLQNGRKAGCWSWWIFPTPPFLKNGRRVGSPQNMIYEIADDEEGLAYLAFASFPLRANYLEMVRACVDQLSAGIAPRMLLGIDVPRFEASAKYFGHLATLAADKELDECCTTALKLLQPRPASDKKDAASSSDAQQAVRGTLDAFVQRHVGGSSSGLKRALPPRAPSSDEDEDEEAVGDGSVRTESRSVEEPAAKPVESAAQPQTVD